MRKKYVCDFETTTDPNDCRVWGYGIRELNNPLFTKVGKDIHTFMDWALSTNSDIYFHNLKFDGSFIVNWLMKNNFRFSKEGEPGTFNALISGMGQWYMIDVVIHNQTDKKNKNHVVFYDSLKKLPFKVKQIGKAFDLPIEKGEIDYHKKRILGHEITSEERKYIVNDVEIVAQALETQFEQGLTKMTNGSDALNDFKEIINKKSFKELFPVLPLEMDKNIRMAYRGGFTWLNEKFKEKEVGEGIVLDVNSMYPGVMVNRDLPVGYPIAFKGEYNHDDLYPLYIQHIRCQFELKDGFIPTIQIKNNAFFKGNEYLKSSDGETVDLYLTNIDIELFFKHYHVYDIEYMSGFKFRKMTGVFDKFIEKWMDVKVNNDGAIKLLAKLMLNSLYGKFATNPDITGKEPYLNDDGSNGFRKGEEEARDPVYTPMGLFITSWARYECITTAQDSFDNIIYCDTDSIHLTGTNIPEGIKDKIDPNKLGYWDLEGTFIRGKYLRQKTYMHDYGDKVSVKCAGMPDSIKENITFENFEVGFTSEGKLIPKQVDGGVILKDTYFTIK